MTQLTEENRNRPWEWENPEPLAWSFMGMDCLVRRTLPMMIWCGYVRLPDEHPWQAYRDGDDVPLDVHGGVTFFGPIPGRDGRWVGFDTAHYGDYMPKPYRSADIRHILQDWELGSGDGVYRTKEWVTLETERMAAQIAKAK